MCPTITAFEPKSINSWYTLPKVFFQLSTDKELMEVSKCWSRSSTPSPGKCLIDVMIPLSWNACIYSLAFLITRSTSLPYVRTFVIGFLKFKSKSTTGENPKFTPTAFPSEEAIFPNVYASLVWFVAATAIWFPKAVPSIDEPFPPSSRLVAVNSGTLLVRCIYS